LGFEASWRMNGGGVGGPNPPSHTCTSPCKCGELISPAGTFEDGSLAGDYSNSADCTWTIVVPGAEWVKIRFVKFDLENRYDYVRLYECPGGGKCEDPTSGTMIAELTGTSVQHGYDGWILARGSLRVHFQSDLTIAEDGFRAVWISSGNTVDPLPSPPPTSTPPPALPPGDTPPPGAAWMDGFCIDSNNHDVNDGVVLLKGRLFGEVDSQQRQCLALCLAWSFPITGCELIVIQWNAGCYAHTSTRIVKANGAGNHWCWLGSGGGGATPGPDDGVEVWPYPPDYEWQRCHLPPDWSRLRPDGYDGLLRTGGLGLKMIPGYFHTWVCHYAHRCARRLGSDVWVPGTGTGSAMGARECEQSCALAGHEYWAESYQYWDHNGPAEPLGCCGHLTCMQTCMMRVTGVDHAACIALVNEVHQAFESAPSEYPCDVEIGGRQYNICGGGREPRLPGTERGEATLQGGLHGCEVGAKPSATANTTDPFCWVYDEFQARFEPFGHGSTVGLL